MDKEFYLSGLRRENERFSATLRQFAGQVAPPVPSCPGWNTLDLLLHIGAGQRMIARLVCDPQAGFTRFNAPPQELAFLELPDPYLEWCRSGAAPAEPIPVELVGWFEQGAHRLEEAFAASDPASPSMTWTPADQTVGFWMRIRLFEATLHGWDLANAYDAAQPIDPQIALNGIDFLLELLPTLIKRRPPTRTGQGETFHFHRTDGPGEWLVRFDPSGIAVSREHAKGDVAVRGTASDLLLFLWRRVPVSAAPLEVFGNAALLDQFFEMVPAI